MNKQSKIYTYKTLSNLVTRLREDLNNHLFVLIFAYLERYAEFDFKFDYENWNVTFSKRIPNPDHKTDTEEPEFIIQDNIKISRGEENIFIWCIFLAICELTIDGAESYSWVKYIYIDDPISSLDDNNAIAVASDLSQLLKKGKDNLKFIISSHHSLFFNVVCNELKKYKCKRYFLHRNGHEGYTLQATDETPFFHHVALLSELEKVRDSGKINTYHFNILRGILEKTATFFGHDDFSECIRGIKDEVLYSRALNLLSHGKYSVYESVEMGEDNKVLFKSILQAFLTKYQFNLPALIVEEKQASADSKKDLEKLIVENDSEPEEREIERRTSPKIVEKIDLSQFEKFEKKRNIKK